MYTLTSVIIVGICCFLLGVAITVKVILWLGKITLINDLITTDDIEELRDSYLNEDKKG